MITFEEARVLHEGLTYDSIYRLDVPRFETPLEYLYNSLNTSIRLLEAVVGKAEIIVFPWQIAMPFQRQWETVPGIKSVREADSWLWGYYMTYNGVDCLAASLTQKVIVSGVRDLRQAYNSSRVTIITVTDAL